jgi:DeoR/GlpR family transcriptional regulator of sugar metabolism
MSGSFVLSGPCCATYDCQKGGWCVNMPSKKVARQARILTALDSNPALRVSDLAAQLDVSAETIRRDLTELEERGRITRTYGGAVRSQAFELALTERLKLKVPERQRIARKAIELVADVDSIFIGGGASTLHFARALSSIDRRLQVITAAFSIAQEMAANPRVQVMALPGLVEAKEGLVFGGETLAAIRKYRPPVAVIGASGITEEGVSEALMSAAQVYTAMIENADETLVLADRTKFGHRALQIITRWQPCRTLVSDAAPDAALNAAVCDVGARVIISPLD